MKGIGIIGKMRSGKDTVGAYLVEHYGFTRFAFGDAIKRLCEEMYPEQVANGVKPRALYQGVGQDLRKYDPDVWIKRTLAAIDGARVVSDHSPFLPVITDVRQPNEYETLRQLGFVLVRVEAPESLRIHRAITSGDNFNLSDMLHGTETALDYALVDYVLTNSTNDVRDLQLGVEALMNALFTKTSADKEGDAL